VLLASLGRSSTSMLGLAALAEKRHLPVIGTTPSLVEGAPTRSAAHWIVLGAVLIVILSMPLLLLGMWASGPLAMLAERSAHQLAGDARVAKGWAAAATILPLITAFAVAAFAGCYVAVRHGRLRRYAAALVGILGGILLASVAAFAQGPFTAPLLWAAVYSVLTVMGGLSGLVAERLARHTSEPA
jgi:hypothetical protein